jgi:hypothetical protein
VAAQSVAGEPPAAEPGKDAKEEAKPEEPKPWTMPQPCFLKEHGWTIGGWLDAGMTFNGAYPSDGYNSPVGFNDLNQQPQINQLYLTINKAVDTKGCGIDFGGSFDVMYGTDARFTQGNGLETAGNPTATVFPGPSFPLQNFNYANSPYRFALQQAYFDLGINDLTIRTGHMVTNLGAETIDPRNNFFYSHSYTFLYGIPYTHTGMMFTYKFDDEWTAMTGIQTGENQFDYSPASALPGTNFTGSGAPAAAPGQYQHLGYLGGLTWTDPCKRGNINLQMSLSEDQNNFSGFNSLPASGLADSVLQLTAIGTYNVSDKLTYIAEGTYGAMQDPVDGTASWYGINQYFKYTINDKWAAGLRAEWFQDASGVVVYNPEMLSANTVSNGLRPVSFPGNFYEITAGLNWKPNLNVTLRPEVRYDWSDAVGTAGATTVLPYNAGASASQFLFAVDAILTF